MGIAWTLIVVVPDSLFTVLLFKATCYPIDLFVYYALTFLNPAGPGLYLAKRQQGSAKREG